MDGIMQKVRDCQILFDVDRDLNKMPSQVYSILYYEGRSSTWSKALLYGFGLKLKQISPLRTEREKLSMAVSGQIYLR